MAFRHGQEYHFFVGILYMAFFFVVFLLETGKRLWERRDLPWQWYIRYYSYFSVIHF